MSEAEKIVEVAAAILLRQRGDGSTEYLLARRPQGKVYAGYWEFPGGKVEPGETLHQALLRELHEELGIRIERAWPWLSCRFTYPHATVRLKFFHVIAWRGEIEPIEHDGFVWVGIGQDAPVAPVLPANGPILRALELPAEYTQVRVVEGDSSAATAAIAQALNTGSRLFHIDAACLPEGKRQDFVVTALQLASRHPEARVLIEDNAELARVTGAHGLHLSASRLMPLETRPAFDRVAATCRNAKELAHAIALGLDFVILWPEPQATEMDWPLFSRMIEFSPIPVYAGINRRSGKLELARQHGAHGVAKVI